MSDSIDTRTFLDRLEGWLIGLLATVIVLVVVLTLCCYLLRALFASGIMHTYELHSTPQLTEIQVHRSSAHRRRRKSRPKRRRSPRRRFREEIEQELDGRAASDESTNVPTRTDDESDATANEEEGRRATTKRAGQDPLRIKSDNVTTHTIQSIVHKLRPTPSTMQTLLESEVNPTRAPLFTGSP